MINCTNPNCDKYEQEGQGYVEGGDHHKIQYFKCTECEALGRGEYPHRCDRCDRIDDRIRQGHIFCFRCSIEKRTD